MPSYKRILQYMADKDRTKLTQEDVDAFVDMVLRADRPTPHMPTQLLNRDETLCLGSY